MEWLEIAFVLTCVVASALACLLGAPASEHTGQERD